MATPTVVVVRIVLNGAAAQVGSPVEAWLCVKIASPSHTQSGGGYE
jgi:hypothetical protein